MNIDFAFVLVVLTFLAGIIWGVDSLLFRQRRRLHRPHHRADV